MKILQSVCAHARESARERLFVCGRVSSFLTVSKGSPRECMCVCLHASGVLVLFLLKFPTLQYEWAVYH